MRVSIVIAAYNAERFLAETLDSVLAQTLTDWELIVVDDASRDGTSALAQKYCQRDARIRLVRQEKSGGCAAPARNRGFAESTPTTPFVIFLDHDDVWEPNALEWLVAALEAQPEKVGAHGIHRNIDAAGEPLDPNVSMEAMYTRMGVVGKRLMKWRTDQPTTFAVMVTWCCVETPGLVMARRSALPPVDPFPFHDGTGLDWDLWLDLCRRGDFAFVNRVILNYRKHDANASGNLRRLAQRIVAVRQRLWSAPENSPSQRRLVRSGYRAIERHFLRSKLQYARDAMLRGNIVAFSKQSRYAVGHLLRSLRGSP